VSVDATGAIGLDSITAAGGSPAANDATGSIVIDALSLSGTAGVSVPATGSIALGSIILAGVSGLSSIPYAPGPWRATSRRVPFDAVWRLR
jgi:hypothetical protein